MRRASPGKFIVQWVDSWNHEDGVYGEYDTAEEALETARVRINHPDKTMNYTYYVFDDQANYLGGNTPTTEQEASRE